MCAHSEQQAAPIRRRCTNARRRVARLLNFVRYHLISAGIASCHSSGALNFEVDPTFLENMCICVLGCSYFSIVLRHECVMSCSVLQETHCLRFPAQEESDLLCRVKHGNLNVRLLETWPEPKENV